MAMARPLIHFACFWMAISTVCIALPSPITGQSSDACRDTDAQRISDSATSPVYADATALARTLTSRGFEVQCIRRSKEENLFAGQKGAAWFKTDLGVFEVWFLPESANFSNFRVIEKRRGDNLYVYSFRGTPRVSRHFESSRPIIFLPNGNFLFEVSDNKPLAKRLALAVHSPQPVPLTLTQPLKP
jgi:hypothetical protein